HAGRRNFCRRDDQPCGDRGVSGTTGRPFVTSGRGGTVSETTKPLLHFDAVSVHYGPIQALRDVTYRVDPGEIVCLLGGNASGKSTTMKAALGVANVTQ